MPVDVFHGHLLEMAKNMKKQRLLSQLDRTKILERDGYVCAYCIGEAYEVDHILPWDWNHNDSEDNLVACCRDCNSIAGDKVFESRQDKYNYINSVRNGSKWQRKLNSRVSICIRCKKTYKPRVSGSTVFLCSECVSYGWKE